MAVVDEALEGATEVEHKVVVAFRVVLLEVEVEVFRAVVELEEVGA